MITKSLENWLLNGEGKPCLLPELLNLRTFDIRLKWRFEENTRADSAEGGGRTYIHGIHFGMWCLESVN